MTRTTKWGLTPKRGRHRPGFRGSCAAILAGLAILVRVPSAPAAQEPQPSVPVILISVDTLRADHLSCYGYGRFRTPQIDSLGQGGTVFTEIDSQIPLTLPSHTSLLTSTYPFANGVEENGQQVPSGAVTLAGVLKSRGYRTAAFIGGYFLARRFGLDQGFDVYSSPFGSTSGSLAKAIDLKRPAGEVTREATQWLAGNAHQPFFLFIHLFDLHRPYDPPAPYRARYHQDEYDAELGYVDAVLGRFWDFLARHGLFERSLIVFTADHGESLGEHGESTHGYFVYQSTLHVPLIIHWPKGMAPYPARAGAPAGLVDVAPTIVQALGLPEPATFQGQSLLPLLNLQTPAAERKVYSESLYAHDNFRCAPLRSLRVGHSQYIATAKPELYDLSQDPGELHNLEAGKQAIAESLRNELDAQWSEYRAPTPAVQQSLRPEVRANLRSLGYVSVSRPQEAPEEAGPDPKDRLAEYRQSLRATRLSETGRFSEAAATFREILEEDPENLTAHYELANCYVHERRFFDAVQQLRAALALDPYNVNVQELLGTVWLDVRDYGRARAEFEHLLSYAPQDYTAQYNLGVIAVLQGRLDDASRHVRAALDLRPHSAQAHNALGRVYLERGQLTQAQEEFEKALGLLPRLAEAHYNLGTVLEKQKRDAEAAREFRRALQYDPQFAAARQAMAQLESASR